MRPNWSNSLQPRRRGHFSESGTLWVSLPMIDTEHGVGRGHGIERRQRRSPPDLHVGSRSHREQQIPLDDGPPVGDRDLNQPHRSASPMGQQGFAV